MYKSFLFRQYNSCRIQQISNKITHILSIHSRSEDAAVQRVLGGAGSKAADAGQINHDWAGWSYAAEGKTFAGYEKKNV